MDEEWARMKAGRRVGMDEEWAGRRAGMQERQAEALF